jgi:hypothetical protein
MYSYNRMNEYIINPHTSRPVRVGSRTYNNLIKNNNKQTTEKEIICDTEEEVKSIKSKPKPLMKTPVKKNDKKNDTINISIDEYQKLMDMKKKNEYEYEYNNTDDDDEYE